MEHSGVSGISCQSYIINYAIISLINLSQDYHDVGIIFSLCIAQLCLSLAVVGKLQEQSILNVTISFLARQKPSLSEMNCVLYFRWKRFLPLASGLPLRNCLCICNFIKFVEIALRLMSEIFLLNKTKRNTPAERIWE